MIRTAILLLAVLASAADSSAQQAQVVGFVVEVVPPALLRLSPTGPEIALRPIKDVGRPLIEGQTIRAGRRGRVRFKVTVPERVVQLTGADRPYVFKAPDGLSPEGREILAALNAYGRPGGSRGFGSDLYAPADQSVVRLSAFDVRWHLDDSSGSVSLMLRNTPSNVAWSLDGVPASSGRLPEIAAGAVKAAIQRVEGRESGRDEWTLILRSGRKEIRSTFRILPSADEQELLARLSAADKESVALLRLIRRTFTLARFGLFNEVADEYDRALNGMPQSDALVAAAIAAHRRTGNLQRVHDLEAR